METFSVYSVILMTFLGLGLRHTQSMARNIHLTESIKAHFGLLPSKLLVDQISDVHTVEEGTDIFFRCVQTGEPAPPCGVVSTYFNNTLISVNGVLANTSNTHYTFHGTLNGIEFLRIRNVTQTDSGRYSCMCRQSKGRTQFGTNAPTNYVVYVSSVELIVASKVGSSVCISNSSDVFINDTIEFKCGGNDTFLYFENSTKSSNLQAVLFPATQTCNNTQIYCLGHGDTEVCSFERLKVHAQIMPVLTFVERENHTFEYSCASTPLTRNLTWDISIPDDNIDVLVTVHYFRNQSILRLTNITKSLHPNVTCTASLREHTASDSWMFILDSQLQTTFLPPDEGSNVQTVGNTFPLIVIGTFVCACCLFVFLFLLKLAFIFCKNEPEISKADMKYGERASSPSVTITTMNNSTEDGTMEVTTTQDGEPGVVGENSTDETFQPCYNFLEEGLANELTEERLSDSNDSDVIISPVPAPRVNPPSTVPPEEVCHAREIRSILSNGVSARIFRRPSLFEDENDNSLMTSRMSLETLGSDCGDDEEWVRSKSYEALPFSNETFVYKSTYGVRLRLYDCTPDKTTKSIRVIPRKTNKMKSERMSSASSEQLDYSPFTHGINISKFPPNSSPDVNHLRINKWRIKKKTNENV